MNIKMSNRRQSIAWLVLFLFFFTAGKSFAEYDYINISDPFQKKIPIAIPAPVSLSDTQETRQISLQAAGIMSSSLEFTGYFSLIDEKAFLDDPGEQGITASEVNFKNWRDIGSELLVTGGARLEGRVLQLEFRLFDPFRQTLLFGKRYTGEKGDLREMVLKFCDEMIYRLTGDFGVFNTKIAFVSEGENGKAIYIADFDGTNLEKLTGDGNIVLSPAWSPDGRHLAYTSYADDNPDIYIMSMETREEKPLASFQGINITPEWSPDGTRIAATLSFEGDEEIYLLTDTGKVAKRLTRSWGVDVSPTFSPDGRKMAFISGRSGSPQVYVMDFEEEKTSRLTFEGRYNTQPEWSPSGDRIAYSSMSGNSSDIFTIKADGSGLMRLTGDSGRNESPSWSPDGNMIVFSSTRKGSSDIFVMTSSGTEQRRLIDLPGEQSLPDWSPTIQQ